MATTTRPPLNATAQAVNGNSFTIQSTHGVHREAHGYLATITNPASEQYQFTYSTGGLMLTERDPRSNQNTFTYDTMGRLTSDDDPAGGFQTLARTDAGVNFTVTRNTALNYATFVSDSESQQWRSSPAQHLRFRHDDQPTRRRQTASTPSLIQTAP